MDMKMYQSVLDLKTKLESANDEILICKNIIDNYNINLNIINSTNKEILNKIISLKNKNIDKTDDLLKELTSSIYGLISIDKKVKIVNSSFEEYKKSNKEFREKLSTLFPNLTKTDIEYCCYFKLRLTAKEIAHIRFISHYSINVIKNRIKNKIGLDNEDSLSDYLNSLLN